ncbi:hypothetical protein PBPMD00_10 [Pinkberry virus LS07-2018-MD00]|nr:hypothetical protein PBPMD00_10 [Pinkberry virus LS07-2018-MD00]
MKHACKYTTVAFEIISAPVAIANDIKHNGSILNLIF